MASATGGAKPTISIAGRPLGAALQAKVEEVSVDTDLTAPDRCVVTMLDEGRDVLRSLSAEFFEPLKVEAAPIGTQNTEVLFEGHVYAVEMKVDAAGVRTQIVGYDGSYGLRNGRHTKTYNNVTDSDLATTIAQEAGLGSGDIQSTSVVHPQVSQMNESHWDFLCRRAEKVGYVVRVSGTSLDFAAASRADDAPGPGSYASTDPLQLTPGGNLEWFRARTSAAQQVTDVLVRGWDPRQKQVVEAQQRAATTATALGADGAGAAGRNGSPVHLRPEPGLSQQAQCDQLAVAESERMAASFAFAEGLADGDPRLRAGVPVSIGQTGTFDGRYTITRAEHRFDVDGYRTSFWVSGGHDRSLFGLTAGVSSRSLGTGICSALVTNLKDPDGLGRMKLKFPWLADDFESDWARVVHPGAGNERGFHFLSEVGDEVAVSFLNGDPTHPVVIGGFYNGQDAAPFPDHLDSSSGAVVQRGLKTTAGHTIVLDDRSGKEAIGLTTADGKIEILLDQANATVVIRSGQHVQIKADGDATIESKGNVKVDASGKAEIKAQGGIKLESSGVVEIKGAQIKLN